MGSAPGINSLITQCILKMLCNREVTHIGN